MKHKKTLKELFSFNGFKADGKLLGKFGDPKARIIVLTRQKKPLYALAVGGVKKLTMTGRNVNPAIWTWQTTEFMFAMNADVYPVQSTMVCA